MLAMLVLLTVSMAFMQITTLNSNISSKQLHKLQSFYVAEAGIEEALVYIKQHPEFKGIVPTMTMEIGTNQVNVTSSENHNIKLTSIGFVNDSKYTLQAIAEVKNSKGFTSHALTAYGCGSDLESVFDNNSMVEGDYLINHKYTINNHAKLNGVHFTDEVLEFPEFDSDWYNNTGRELPDKIIYGNASENDFKTGEKYYYVNGDLNFTSKTNLILDNVIIEVKGNILIAGNIEVEGIVFVTDNDINVANKTELKNIVMVGNNITFNNNIDANNILLYSNGKIKFDNTLNLTGVVIARQNIEISNNSTINGNVICKYLSMDNHSKIIIDDSYNIPILPSELGTISVSLISYK